MATLAAIKALKEKRCEKIVITRPNVAVDDRGIGHLPGNINDKMAPWWRPINDILRQYYTKAQIDHMLEEEIIELSPLAFMRGRTFNDSFIIMDEAQNSSPEQMKMFITRIGYNSKMLITGDTNQRDLKVNGLTDICSKLDASNDDYFDIVEFAKEDIERNPIITKILHHYGE